MEENRKIERPDATAVLEKVRALSLEEKRALLLELFENEHFCILKSLTDNIKGLAKLAVSMREKDMLDSNLAHETAGFMTELRQQLVNMTLAALCVALDFPVSELNAMIDLVLEIGNQQMTNLASGVVASSKAYNPIMFQDMHKEEN